MSSNPKAPTPEEVFASYGRVMAKIGAFEQFLRIALAEHEVARRKKSGIPLNTEAFSRRLMKLEFGSLAQQVCDKFKFGDDLRAVVKQAKGFRNHLAHEFWATQFHNMHSERGRRITCRDCALYETQFERVAQLIVGAAGVDTASYVAFVAGNANRPEIFKEWEQLLDGAEKVMRETGQQMFAKEASDGAPA
jgi:hypothetical protein